jgi:hypothetical protein
MGIGMWLPFSPLAATLGFVHLPLLYWPILFVTLLCYFVLTQIQSAFRETGRLRLLAGISAR